LPVKTHKPKQILFARHLLLKTIRSWFYKQGFWEIQVPCSAKEAIPEANIDLFEIEGERYLLPSPELHLKPHLSLQVETFFHIGPAFRKGEKGTFHNTEFTLLEWYRSGVDYLALMDDCIEILAVVFDSFKKKTSFKPRLATAWNPDRGACIFTIEDIFTEYAGWNPVELHDERRFEQDLVTKIEPVLPTDTPVILKDFPSWASSLSKVKDSDPRVCERFELYLGGIELANGFTELVDPQKQLIRFQKENLKRIKYGLKPIDPPKKFLTALGHCPPSAGIALGIDRLLMLLVEADHIRQVIPPLF